MDQLDILQIKWGRTFPNLNLIECLENSRDFFKAVYKRVFPFFGLRMELAKNFI